MKEEIKYPILAEFHIDPTMEEYYLFKNGKRVLLLGEISNMPGHVVLVDNENQVFWGYHLSDFRILTTEET